jgi:phage tail-like protein
MKLGRAPFLLLDGRAGWREQQLENLVLDIDALTLAPVPESGQPLSDPAGTLGGLALPSGVALAPDGSVVLVDPGTGELKRYDACEGRFETLPCSRPAYRGRGLAVSRRGDLYVTDGERLSVYTLKGLVLRWSWAPKEAWDPRDVVVDDRCHAYVADRSGGIVHVLDARGLRLDPLPHAGGARLSQPVHLAFDRAGRLYVVQEDDERVAVLDTGSGALLETVTQVDDIRDRFDPPPIEVDPEGGLTLPGPEGRPLRFDRFGNPLSSPATAIAATRFEAAGVYLSQPLDSGIDRCRWHSVELVARAAAGGRLAVETFTANTELALAQVLSLSPERWAAGPLLTTSTVGGDEWDCLVLSPPGRFLWLRLTLAGDGASTPEVESIRVRYPRDSSLRHLPAVYREEPTSADFLDRFLSIFDTIRRRLTERVDDFASHLDPYGAPDVENEQDVSFLSWLASWLGLALDRTWPTERRRRLVAEAHELFRLRGTLQGVRRHVEVYAGVEPRILEGFKLRRLLFVDESRLGGSSELWGPEIVRRLQLDAFSRIGEVELIDRDDPLHDPFAHFANRFTVFVPARAGLDAKAVERIVALARPAHTEGEVRLVEPRLRIGTQAFIGVDTVVGKYPDRVVLDEARIGHETVLGASAEEAQAPHLRIGRTTRIGPGLVID